MGIVKKVTGLIDQLFGSSTASRTGRPRSGKGRQSRTTTKLSKGSDTAIGRAMLQYIAPPRVPTRPSKPDLSGWRGFDPSAARFIESSPNAFLLGVLFDRMINATAAWEAPYRLSLRLGHLDVDRLAQMAPQDLAQVIGRTGGQRALHRFPNKMAAQTVEASKKLVRDYAGDASNIWPSGTQAGTVVARLQEFNGISHKLASMTARLLVSYYGVHLTGWNNIDIAEDRHVARVFLRTGLVAKGKTSRQAEFRVAEIRDQIIDKARLLSPKYPGALDEPAFFIGQGWCTAARAWCGDGEEPCPLVAVCPQERLKWGIRG